MVNKKFKVNSRDKQSKTTGVRHSDDDVKKAVVDRIFKIEQLNNIPERYVANHSNCSRSSIGRMCKCKFDGQSPIPDWTTIHNYSACIIGKSEFIPGFPEVLCHVLNLIVDDSADIDCTVDNDCHIDIEIRFHTSKKLVKDPTEKEGDKEIGRKRNNKK